MMTFLLHWLKGSSSKEECQEEEEKRECSNCFEVIHCCCAWSYVGEGDSQKQFSSSLDEVECYCTVVY